jgi:hypothetical protein
MNCRYCGSELLAGASFCRNCGERVSVFTGIVAQPVEPIHDQSAKRVDTSELKLPDVVHSPETENLATIVSRKPQPKATRLPVGFAYAFIGAALLFIGAIIGWTLYRVSLPRESMQARNRNTPDLSVTSNIRPTPRNTNRPTIVDTPTPEPTSVPTPYPTPARAAELATSTVGGWLTEERYSHRIHFNRGSVAVTFTGRIGESELPYVFRAGAGQTLDIVPIFYQGNFRPGVFEQNTGRMLTPSKPGSFTYYLPSTGDYLIVLNGTPGTQYRLSIEVGY